MLAIILATSMITARAQSSYTTIEYNKIMQPALVLELPNTTDDVKGTILNKLKQIGYNPETQGAFFWKKYTTDGFYIFEKVVLPSISTQTLDMYFKVVQKNKEEKNNSTLYLLVSSGNENFSSPEKDTTLWHSSQTFLNGFVENTTAYSLEQHIKVQENMVSSSQKKLASLQNDEKDLAEKIKKYQEDLANNLNHQKGQQQDIEDQQKLLGTLIQKRKG